MSEIFYLEGLYYIKFFFFIGPAGNTWIGQENKWNVLVVSLLKLISATLSLTFPPTSRLLVGLGEQKSEHVFFLTYMLFCLLPANEEPGTGYSTSLANNGMSFHAWHSETHFLFFQRRIPMALMPGNFQNIFFLRELCLAMPSSWHPQNQNPVIF